MQDHKFKRNEDNVGALVNTDIKALQAYKEKKKQFAKIGELSDRMDRIENLLLKLIEKNGIS